MDIPRCAFDLSWAIVSIMLYFECDGHEALNAGQQVLFGVMRLRLFNRTVTEWNSSTSQWRSDLALALLLMLTSDKFGTMSKHLILTPMLWTGNGEAAPALRAWIVPCCLVLAGLPLLTQAR